MDVLKQESLPSGCSTGNPNKMLEDYKPLSEDEPEEIIPTTNTSTAPTPSQPNTPSHPHSNRSSRLLNTNNLNSNTIVGSTSSDSKVHWSNEAAHHLLDSVEKYREQYEAKGGAQFWVNVTNAFCTHAEAYANFAKQNIITKWKNLRRDVRSFQEHPEKFTRQADVLLRTQKLMQSMGLNISTLSSANHHHQHYYHPPRRSMEKLTGCGSNNNSSTGRTSFASAKVGKIVLSKKSLRKSAANGGSLAAPVPIAPYPPTPKSSKPPTMATKPSGISSSGNTSTAVTSSSICFGNSMLFSTSNQNNTTVTSVPQVVQHLLAGASGSTDSATNLYHVVSPALNNNNGSGFGQNASSCSGVNRASTATCVVGQATLQQLLASASSLGPNSCGAVTTSTVTSTTTTTPSTAADCLGGISGGLTAVLQNGALDSCNNNPGTLVDILDEIIRIQEIETNRLHDIVQHFHVLSQQSTSRLCLFRHFRNLYLNNDRNQIPQRQLVQRIAGDTEGQFVTEEPAVLDSNGVTSANSD